MVKELVKEHLEIPYRHMKLFSKDNELFAKTKEKLVLLDASLLSDLINQVKDSLDTFTLVSQEKLLDALVDAESTLVSARTNKEYADAYNTLNDIYEQSVKVMTKAQFTTISDTIKELKEIDRLLYTQDSLNKFDSIILEADTLIKDAQSTYQSAEDMIKKLATAKDVLVKNPIDKPDIDKPDIDKPDIDKPDIDKPNIDKPTPPTNGNKPKPPADGNNTEKPGLPPTGISTQKIILNGDLLSVVGIAMLSTVVFRKINKKSDNDSFES